MPLRIHPDPPCAPILSVRLLRQGGPDTVLLRHPLVERYAASPPPHRDPAPPLVLDRDIAGPWEVFGLIPVPDGAQLPPSLAQALDAIATALAARLPAASVLAWIEQAAPLQLAIAGEALLRLASPDLLDAIGQAVAGRPHLHERFRAACFSDAIGQDALAELAAWIPTRPRRARITVGPELDRLGRLAEPARPVVELSLHLLAAVRRHVEPIATSRSSPRPATKGRSCSTGSPTTARSASVTPSSTRRTTTTTGPMRCSDISPARAS